MERCFLGIDFQYDFMEGGNLAVNGAMDKAEKCADFLTNHKDDYKFKVFTADFHPYNHCSFKENGGEWSRHCVEHTKGAAIYDALINAAYATNGDTKILKKGILPDKEEYSIFDNQYAKIYLENRLDEFDEIHVCGIVGTICVKNSLIGLMKVVPKEKIVVLMDYTANFDDGTEMKQWLDEVGIKWF